VDDPSTHALERRLLQSGLYAGPTDAAVEGLWSALAGRLPANPSGVSAAPIPARTGFAAGRAASVGIGRAIAVVSLGTLAALAGEPSPPPARGVPEPTVTASVSASPEQAPVPPPSAQATVPAVEPVSPPRSPATTIAREARRTAPSAAGEGARESVSDEEIRRILLARRALREGDCGAAIRLLEATRAGAGAFGLAEEREVLAIAALACEGRTEEATARAEAFLATHPRSIHAASMRRIAGVPAREE
jgi:hypothetical protein